MSLPGGSGAREMIINSRERPLSTDVNRLQRFQAADLAAYLAYFLLASSDADANSAGFESLSVGQDTPSTAVVLQGLRFRPEVGTANAFVEPGVVVMADPDASPNADDLPWKVVYDAGVQLAGALTLSPGGGSTRIDVVECSRVTTVVEQDNRDVFDVSTGLFTATLVDKVQVGQLVYRIRQGTPGAGFPANQQGWLPIAVCSVPAAATTWDAVTVWDVRPLAADRWNAPFNSAHQIPRRGLTQVQTDKTTVSGQVRLSGWLDLDLLGYRAGGKLGSDAGAWLDLNDAQFRGSGYTFPSFGWWHLWLAFPFNLPRWVRYTPSTNGLRVPGSLRGIPVLAGTGSLWNGRPMTGIPLPDATGLGGSTIIGVLAASGWTDNTPKPRPILADGKTFRVSDWVQGGEPNSVGINVLNATSVDNTNQFAVWTNALQDGVTHPGNAKAVWVEVSALQNFGAFYPSSQDIEIHLNWQFEVSGPDGDPTKMNSLVDLYTTDSNTVLHTFPGLGVTSFFKERVFRIPLAPQVPTSTAARQFSVRWNSSGSTILSGPTQLLPLTNVRMSVIAWEL